MVSEVLWQSASNINWWGARSDNMFIECKSSFIFAIEKSNIYRRKSVENRSESSGAMIQIGRKLWFRLFLIGLKNRWELIGIFFTRNLNLADIRLKLIEIEKSLIFIVKFFTGKSATEGIVMAGGLDVGNARTELWSPRGLFVDTSCTLYAADSKNSLVMRYPEGIKIKVSCFAHFSDRYFLDLLELVLLRTNTNKMIRLAFYRIWLDVFAEKRERRNDKS